MARIRKTARREHSTPKRVRFRNLVEIGYNHLEAARIVKVDRTIAIQWLTTRNSDRQTRPKQGRRLIISDAKVEEMAKWITGHFNRRALPFQEITRIHGIKASNNTILAAFARHGYHHHVPNCKPFLSEATKQTR
jgi:hypothetical protein